MKKELVEKIKQRIQQGNLRFRGSPFATLDTNEELRDYLTSHGQHPDTIVVTCSDSRVNPEAIFSSRLGEIFVIRSAGHVCLEGELASVAYAIRHLHSPFVLVLGHTHCGAIESAIKGVKEEELKPILDYVEEAIGDEHDPREAEKKNVEFTVARLKEAFPDTFISGAIYDIASGKVEFLD